MKHLNSEETLKSSYYLTVVPTMAFLPLFSTMFTAYLADVSQ